MDKTRIHLAWSSDRLPLKFRAGVSLHSHTLHSKESLDFIDGAARHCGLLRALLRHGDARHRAHYGTALDLRRGWWTPPLAPMDAYRLEAAQIEAQGLAPMVSLTDHDDIEAPISLQAVNEDLRIPVSVEWTVPWRSTFFHLGVHNLPPSKARGIMRELAAFTVSPKPQEFRSLLGWLSAMPGTLLVVNHPMWDEKGVGREQHNAACLELLKAGEQYLHALELNGLRPRAENEAVRALADAQHLPAISGGDRHGIEPNANLNLTAAASFSEFADEVRQGFSDVLVLPQYRKPHALRLLQNMVDILEPFDSHELGWREWPDRVFYESPDGRVQCLRSWFGKGLPLPVRIFERGVRLVGVAGTYGGMISQTLAAR